MSNHKNKIIAEFMNETIWLGEYNTGLSPSKNLRYHDSWDSLMGVVEKIESIKDGHHGRFGVYIGSNGCTIQATNFRSDKMSEPPMYFYDATLNTKIESTYHCVIKFIEFYNEHLINKENEN